MFGLTSLVPHLSDVVVDMLINGDRLIRSSIIPPLKRQTAATQMLAKLHGPRLRQVADVC